MFDPETTRNTIEWRQAQPEDAAIWVSVTRRSADQIPFESEDSQIARYKAEDPEQQAQRYLLWRDDTPIGRLRFFSYGDTADRPGSIISSEGDAAAARTGLLSGNPLCNARYLRREPLPSSWFS